MVGNQEKHFYSPKTGTKTSLEKAYLLFTCKAIDLSPLLALQFKLSSLFFIVFNMLQLLFLPPTPSVFPKMYVGSRQKSAAGMREACFEDSAFWTQFVYRRYKAEALFYTVKEQGSWQASICAALKFDYYLFE